MTSPEFNWYLLVTLKAYDTSSLVHYIAYMIDPITKAYGVILMFVLSSCVFRHMNYKRVIPLNMGMYPLLDHFMLKLSYVCIL